MLEYGNIKISLDRREKGSDIDFISHAHSDHIAAAKSSKTVLASVQTIQLIEQVQSLTLQSNNSNQKMRLLEAGHMLGSRQLCLDDNTMGKRIVYTGDFQMANSKTSNPIEIVSADTIIMDSTYGNSLVKFDDKFEVETQMRDWTAKRLREGIVLFSAYAMGKAQELVAIFNEMGVTPVVSEKISKVCGVYRQNGIRLDYCSAYDRQSDYSDIISGDFIGITEKRDMNILKHGMEFAHDKSVFTAVATGFSKIFRFDVDGQFPLSDHADIYQSMDYIEAAGAREILTYGPNAVQFAKNLCQKGYNAAAFCPTYK